MLWVSPQLAHLQQATSPEGASSSRKYKKTDYSLLNEVGKVYGRVLIKRVRGGTEYAIREEQCGLR